MDFPERLKKLMAEKHETRYRLGKIIGVHGTTVDNWLTGKTTPQLAHSAKLAEHFGCTVEELMASN